MDYFLSEEQQMIKEIAAKIASEKVRPVRAELDDSEEFPWDLMKILAQSDLFGVNAKRCFRLLLYSSKAGC